MFAASAATNAQERIVYNDFAETQFLIGTRQFAQKDFAGAYSTFQKIFFQKPYNQRTTAAMLMGAKALYRQRQYYPSVQLLKNFLNLFPSSLYVEDAHYTIGIDEYALSSYLDAAQEMLFVLDHGAERRTLARAQRLLENLVSEFLSSDEIAALSSLSHTKKTALLLSLYDAEKKWEAGNAKEAIDEAKRVSSQQDDEELARQAQMLVSRFEVKGFVKIGVILPLMHKQPELTREKKLAEEMYDGITFAVDAYNTGIGESGTKVKLDVGDSEHDPVTAMNVVQPWLADSGVVAIVGPIFSNVVSAAARYVSPYRIPLISPTATDNGLAAISQYIFQANPDYATRGKLMAQYAVLKLGYKNLGVIAPQVMPSSAMADSFVAEAVRLGATIVSQQRYVQGSTDLRSLFRAMRQDDADFNAEYSVAFAGKLSYGEIINRLATAGVHKSFVDSLKAADTEVFAANLFSANGKHILDSLQIPTQKVVVDVDSLQYPVTAMQAVYCPIASSDDIGVITSQMIYYNIRAAILGSDEWDDLNELDLNKRYADGVIFSSDRWNEDSFAYHQFAGRFLAATGHLPNDNVLFGYDTMELLLHLIQHGGTSREALPRMLAQVSNYQGFHSRISLTEDRVNSWLTLLQYKRGKVSKIGEFEYKKNP
ncbi:MAG: ABC transporter substrate-binding protein [Bacteroidota bacterium]|nr:ABC transporter substrate-binding protein [Bacteroidota bacterium]